MLPITMGCYLRRPDDATREDISLLCGDKLHPFMFVTVQEIFNKFNFDMEEGLNFFEFSKFSETVGNHVTEE